jgi:hypothetical protein
MLGVGDVVDDARVAPVLRAVGGVDLVVDSGVGIFDRDVLLDAPGAYPRLAALACDAMPAAAGPVGGADVKWSPARTTQIGTGLRSEPSRRRAAISSSWASAIRSSSSLVQAAITGSPPAAAT